MKYIYSITLNGRHDELLADLNAAATRLIDKLHASNLDGISEYNQSKIAEHLANSVANFQLFCHLLYLALADGPSPTGETAIIDHGGGCGLLSLLAKELGVGRVIYSDIYDLSCQDVERLSARLGLPIDDIVCGDIEELINGVRQRRIRLHAVVSRDVIEHIYDIDGFIQSLPRLADEPFRVVFSSGANTKNPLKNIKYRRMQREYELRDRSRAWGHKERDSLQSFFAIRREMIDAFDSTFPPEVVEQLTRRTRGLMQADIQRCIEEYRRFGKISYRQNHPTNTCDPFTGNWTEHLMDFGTLERNMKRAGFSPQILAGYYAQIGGRPILTIKAILNFGIKHFGAAALCFSPYYILYGERR